MPSAVMGPRDGAPAGTPGQQRQYMHQGQDQQHQQPLPPHLDDGGSSSSPSRSSYSQDFGKHPDISQPRKTSLLSSLNPRNWTRKMRLFAIIAFVLAVVALVPAIAVPLTLRQADHNGSVDTPQLVNPPPTSSIADNIDLRIMPLGASITFGLKSSDGNGYRDKLQELLSRSGTSNIEFVGSRRSGSMASNAVEGWPGLRIDQVLPKARASVPVDLPNVILLNLGTNDCVQNYNLDNTTQTSPTAPELTADPTFTVGTRMRMVVEDLLAWSPNVTVVMSTLINNRVERVQDRTLDANDQFRSVAADLQAQGKKVVIAEMSASAGGPNMTTMFDQTHPTDIGYAMMANRFYVAMQEASAKGMISAPLPK
ncbi:hypothetical protein KVR01_009566 [Diaporthe batatas]|uniref:uncharacterized protein n=1 Tax=Diaporthe batatas TaxID=748121 RepID=UPI001D04E7A0|nr:uncharacterized protein KVR01_009566 [Diaporthe batatas]KAG8161302.1 hypothetical protein KVR01_009566 [Diaporthe batatas]